MQVVGNANKHIARVAKFLTKYGELALFPVKLQASILFTALEAPCLTVSLSASAAPHRAPDELMHICKGRVCALQMLELLQGTYSLTPMQIQGLYCVVGKSYMPFVKTTPGESDVCYGQHICTARRATGLAVGVCLNPPELLRRCRCRCCGRCTRWCRSGSSACCRPTRRPPTTASTSRRRRTGTRPCTRAAARARARGRPPGAGVCPPAGALDGHLAGLDLNEDDVRLL